MHRVDSDGNDGGFFQEGDVTTGDEPTQLGAKWHNAVQEEIVNVVDAAGIALDDGDNDQLLEAIGDLIVAASGPKADKTTTITGGGLATGGGSLAASRVINVPKASGAEVEARADDTKAVTPAGLANLIGDSDLGGEVTIVLAGRILKMGTTSVFTGDTTGNFQAFQQPFLNACFGVVLSPIGANGTNAGASRYGWSVESVSAAGFTLTNDCPATAFYYQAWGE